MSHISYSQFSMYSQCPLHWKLNYIDKVGFFEPSIFLIFGTAMHETLQKYLDVMYNQTIKNADELDLPKILQENLVAEFKKNVYEIDQATPELVYPCTKEQLNEFYDDGIFIIEFFKTKRGKYFNKNWDLLGCEFPLNVKVRKNLRFVGFIDVILRHRKTGKIRIIDIKTATRGWRASQKTDKTKNSQLLLYKWFYSAKYNVSLDDIAVEFFIVKRKIAKKSDFPQSRIQIVRPSDGKINMGRVVKGLEAFVENAFDEDGEYLDVKHRATPSVESCRYCEFWDTEYCDKGMR